MFHVKLIISLAIFVFHQGSVGIANGLSIIGCPLFGCRPSGSFSYNLNVTRRNPSIAWVSTFPCSPIPRPLGCVGNDVNLVCLSNGLGIYDTGYVSINTTNGSVKWRDKVLQYPTLPMLSNYGDAIGSDGIDLVKYEYDGTLNPIIYLNPVMKPVFSMQLLGTQFLLMVSEHGYISTRITNGVPVAEILLQDKIGNTNGTFFPVSQPVVNGNRLYVVTEFVPDDDQHTKSDVIGLQRLYAVDVHDRMVNIMNVAWHFSFNSQSKKPADDSRLIFKPTSWKNKIRRGLNRHGADDVTVPSLLWNQHTQTVEVILTPSLLKSKTSSSPKLTSFWGIRDSGNSSKLAYRNLTANYIHMALFEANTGGTSAIKGLEHKSPLWTIQANGIITAVNVDGTVDRIIDVAKLLQSPINVTSKMVTIRQNDTDNDILVFAVFVQKTVTTFANNAPGLGVENVRATSTANYVVAIDTTLDYINNKKSLLWMVATPKNMTVRGQVVGIPGADLDRKDQLAVFSQTEGESVQFFAIH